MTDGEADVARLQAQMESVREDVKEQRTDIKAIKAELGRLHDEVRGRKMTFGEKVMLAGVACAVIGTIITVITVLSSSPTP